MNKDTTENRTEKTVYSGRKDMRKAGLLLLAAVVLTGGTAGLTGAYFTHKEDVVNSFTVGKLNTGLKESDWDPDDGDGEDMLPGKTLYKNPTVRNETDSNDCYLRMTIEVKDEKGQAVTDAEALEMIAQTVRFDEAYTGTYENTGSSAGLTQGRVPGYSLADLAGYPNINPLFVRNETASSGNRQVFEYLAADGSGILKPGEEAVLFTTIVIPTDWTQDDVTGTGNYQLHIFAEAIQAEGFADAQEAFAQL